MSAPKPAASRRPPPRGGARKLRAAVRFLESAVLTPPLATDAQRLQDWCMLLDGLGDAAWIVHAPSLRIVAENAAARRLLAAPGGSLIGLRADTLVATPEDLAFWDEAQAGGADAASLLSDTRLCNAAGRELYVTRSIRALAAHAANTANTAAAQRHFLVSVSDRSAQRRAEDEREQVLAELQATLEATADGILVTDLAGRIRAFNRRFAQIWAIPDDLLQHRQDRAVHDWMRASVSDGEAYQRRLQAMREAALPSTSERITLHSGAVLERITRPLWCRGQAMGRVFSFRDISGQLAAQQRIEQLSMTDALTGLPNRRQLAERVAQASAQVRRVGGGFALLLIDLDRFRQINDSLGHAGGDRVLAEVARRVAACLRPGDWLARVGSDQFALFIDAAEAATADATARRVLDAVAAPCSQHGAQFTLTCSIGGAICPAHGHGADELMRHAEAAVLAVKRGGRANYCLQQGPAAANQGADIQLDHAMRQALAAGQFRLHYQPQVDLRSGAVVGAEALLRWRDVALGEVSPARFIAVAEDSGFIIALGDWVLCRAVQQAAAWREAGFSLPVAINVSALQFQQPRFVERVAEVLGANGLPAHCLELELTESILVRDAAEALQRLQALARIGVRLSIDDFGTGYSSLAYLKRFPIDKLKVDRSFVQGLPGDESDAAIVVAILQMARALGMKVIAEGVETAAQRQFLLEHGCDQFQGFLHAPALDSDSFVKRLARPALAAPAPPRIRLVAG